MNQELPQFNTLIPSSINQDDLEEDEKFVWYIIAPGNANAEGPFSAREIDVKFRTNELTSQYHAWKEGMTEWKKVFEVPLLKDKLIESKSEVLEEVVQEYMKTLGKSNDKEKQGEEEDEDSEPDENEKLNLNNDDSDLFYYHKPDKKFKVYNPMDKTWSAQAIKPSEEQLSTLRMQRDEAKAEEVRQIHLIHHDIAGDKSEEPHTASDIANQAAQKVLHDMEEGDSPNKDDNGAVQTMTTEELKLKEQRKLKRKRYQENKKKKWYDTKVNTFVYIQGLPNDVTESELKEYFVRCGVIRLDPYKGEEQIRIYRDEEGVPKGDARIGYAMAESVDMAIEMLNDSEFRPGFKISVGMAEFQQKGQSYVPRKKQKVDKLEMMRIKAEQDRQFGFEEDLEIHKKGLRIVILEHIYTKEEVQANFDRVDYFFEELEIELKGEIEATIGPVEKMQFFKENPKGIVKIRFVSSLHADECKKAMNGRFFDGRQINAYFWDGKTDYRIVRETDEELNRRIDDFGQWLETDEPAESQVHDEEGTNETVNPVE